MIIVTLVATLASAMVWQQWRSVQVESAERARVQATWILTGALDWARLILREDKKSGKVTSLGSPWATPLAEARLSTFLAIDKNNADDGPEAFLSGGITDMQARYNLTNLIVQDKAAAALEVETLERLCQFVGIETGVAQRIANGLRDASAVGSSAGVIGAAPLLPRTVDQLSWLGIDAASIQALRPFVVLLPTSIATPINVNTAPSQVLAAAIKGLDTATAERLVQMRQREAFANTVAFLNQATTAQQPVTARLDVFSNYFEVRGRVRLGDRVLTERSLIQRQPDYQMLVLQRERIASVEEPGS